MKKFALAAFVALFCLSFNSLHAQAYEKGSKVLNLGIGLGGWYSFGFVSPGVSASFEVGMWPTGSFGVIGIGGYTGFRVATDNSAFYDIVYTNIAFAPRGTYHFTIIPVENLDVYAAVQAIFSIEDIHYKDKDFEYLDSNGVVFYPGVVAGVRYFFSDRFGVFGELGYNLNYVTGGISLSF